MKAIGKDIKCISCEASLRGTTLADHCDHCGNDVTATISADFVDGNSLTVRADVPCTNCEYNLRSLSIESLCPECAKPVHLSINSFDLSLADIDWLKSIQNGLYSILVLAIGLPSLILLGVLSSFLATYSRGVFRLISDLIPPLLVLGSILILMVVLSLILEMTTADPHFKRIYKRKSKTKYFYLPMIILILAGSWYQEGLLLLLLIPLFISGIVIHVLKCLCHIAYRSCAKKVIRFSQCSIISFYTSMVLMPAALFIWFFLNNQALQPALSILFTVLFSGGLCLSFILATIAAFKLNTMVKSILADREKADL